jgi:hypothetical protein
MHTTLWLKLDNQNRNTLALPCGCKNVRMHRLNEVAIPQLIMGARARPETKTLPNNRK